MRGFARKSPVEGLARRSVGFFDILAQSLAAVAPTGVAVTFPVIVISQTGGPTLLAALVAIAATLLVAVSINQFARRIAATGSLYTYATKALGPGAGFLTGVALQLGYGFISVFCLVNSARYLQKASGWWASGPPASWLTIVLLTCLGTAVVALIARGIRVTLRVLLVIEAVTAVVVAVLVGTIFVDLRGELSWSLFDFSSATPANVGAGAAIVMTAFVGFESSASLGAEARRPFSQIPRALVWTVIGAGALYFAAAAATVVAIEASGVTAADSSAIPLVDSYKADWVSELLNVSVAVSFFACAVASCTALVRVVFSLGREGALPQRLGRTHPRLLTPVAAALVTVPVLMVLPIALVLGGADLVWIINTSLVVATVGYLFGYLLVSLAAPVFLRRIGELTPLPVACSVAAAVTLVLVLGFYLTHQWDNGGRIGLIGAGAGLVAGVAYYLLWVMPRPAIRDRIGVYDEPVLDDVLGGADPNIETPAVSQ